MSRIYSRFKTILASILIACIVLNLFPLSLLALDTPCYSVSDKYDFSVTRVISSRWEDHANIVFTITNNGNTTINNWYITTDLPYDVENIWNASIAETSDRYITISSAPQNQPIEPGCSVTFGITGYSEDDSLFDMESSFYLLNVEDVVIPVEKYQATTNVYSTTETGFSGAIAITNISTELLTIENVILNSTNGLTIIGNASIEDETTLVVDSSSRNIYPSASIYINFKGTGEIPEVLDLRYTGLAFTLTEDENNDRILDIDEFLYPEQEPEVTPTPTIAPTNTPEAEPTETPTVTPEEEPTPTPEEVTPTPIIDPFEYYSDDDGDGLSNSEENSLGTDPNDYDTDADGISDGNEVFMGYNPLSQDSDSDGILDSNEDFDEDGIINIDEATFGSSLFVPDTDYDGISDYDEVFVYNSNPDKKDTDGDGIHDGDELILGKKPTDSSDFGITVNQTISQEINNVEDPAITSVDITMDYVGNMESSVSVDDLYDIDTYSTDIYSRIGSPLGFNSEFEFDSATVVIHYDDTVLGDTSEDRLGVLWFDEEHGVYIVQDQAIIDAENNTVTLELEHFSTYVIVDIDEWRNAFNSDNRPNDTMIVEGTSSYIMFSPNATPPSIESREQDAFAWWKLTQSGQYRIVERLSGECQLREGTTGTYDYTYTWLVEDITDDDNDGLFDYYELNGMLLSNGTIYFTSTNTDDSDGDGISDLEEAGIGYRIERDANGRITVYANEQIVLSGVYYIDASSPYYYLNDYINTSSVTIENDLDFWVPISDPNNPDSDNDGYKDYEDARAWVVNEKVIYLFNLEGSYKMEVPADLYASLYEEKGYTVIRGEFNSTESFFNCWESIGRYCSTYESFVVDPSEGITYNGNPYGDKYYYDAEHVVIISHGRENFILLNLNETDYLVTSATSNSNKELLYINQLADRRIYSLNLYSCLTGKLRDGVGDSVTSDFLSYHPNIQQVVAPDAVIKSSIDQESGQMTVPFYFVTYIDQSLYHEITNEEYKILLPEYISDTSNFEATLPEPIYGCTGFRCFTRNGNYDIFADDVVYGECYHRIPEIENENNAFIVVDSNFPESFSSIHEYVLNGQLCNHPLLLVRN